MKKSERIIRDMLAEAGDFILKNSEESEGKPFCFMKMGNEYPMQIYSVCSNETFFRIIYQWSLTIGMLIQIRKPTCVFGGNVSTIVDENESPDSAYVFFNIDYKSGCADAVGEWIYEKKGNHISFIRQQVYTDQAFLGDCVLTALHGYRDGQDHKRNGRDTIFDALCAAISPCPCHFSLTGAALVRIHKENS